MQQTHKKRVGKWSKKWGKWWRKLTKRHFSLTLTDDGPRCSPIYREYIHIVYRSRKKRELCTVYVNFSCLSLLLLLLLGVFMALIFAQFLHASCWQLKDARFPSATPPAPTPPSTLHSVDSQILRGCFYLKWKWEKWLCVCERLCVCVSGFTYVHSLPTEWNLLHHIKSNRIGSIWIVSGALTTHFSFKLLSFLSGKWCQISINF